MILEFNEQEGQALINLLNEAVKAKGLEAAEAANFFFNKVKNAHVEALKKKEEVVLSPN